MAAFLLVVMVASDTTCKHGGVINNATQICEGCLGAWSGKLCDQWDSSIPLSQLMDGLDAVAQQSQQQLDQQIQYNPLCRQSQECVGWGVDGATNSPALFPVVELTYLDPTRVFDNFTEPIEAIVTPHLSPVAVYSTEVFPTISDFTNYVDSSFRGASPPGGSNGLYGSNYSSVFASYFHLADDRALSVTKSSFAFVDLSLPPSSTTHEYKFSFDRFAKQALLSLPPDYTSDTNKRYYRAFIKRYGTSTVIKASLGGSVEEHTSWKAWLTDADHAFTKQKLADNAKKDFTSTTGLGGHTGALDPGYDDTTRNVVLECDGGDPSLCTSAAGVKSWQASILKAPRLLSFKVIPTSELITDPGESDTKAALQQAVAAYIREQQQQWETLDKCPLNCNGT
jgi:hypothetical protein